MKYVYIALLLPLLFLSGLYAGLEWGLSARPLLDVSKCETLTYYEDGSFDCDPDGAVKADSYQLPLESVVGGYQPTVNPQQTQDGWHFQPVRSEQ